MLGPVRFRHIETTAEGAVRDLERMEKLEGLYEELEGLDETIKELRMELSDNLLREQNEDVVEGGKSEIPVLVIRSNTAGSFRKMTDPVKLEKLIKARGMTLKLLVEKVAGQVKEKNKDVGESG